MCHIYDELNERKVNRERGDSFRFFPTSVNPQRDMDHMLHSSGEEKPPVPETLARARSEQPGRGTTAGMVRR